jgi:hypothetical protein
MHPQTAITDSFHRHQRAMTYTAGGVKEFQRGGVGSRRIWHCTNILDGINFYKNHFVVLME